MRWDEIFRVSFRQKKRDDIVNKSKRLNSQSPGKGVCLDGNFTLQSHWSLSLSEKQPLGLKMRAAQYVPCYVFRHPPLVAVVVIAAAKK